MALHLSDFLGKVESISELEFAIETSREAGRIVMELANTSLDVKQKTPLKGDVVTNADMASNKYIIDRIRERFPNDAILTEESVDDQSRLGNKRVWIIDPIDGTKNYSDYALSGCKDQSHRYFAIHIGLAVDRKAVLGVVFAPVTGELFYASQGNGAYKVVDGKEPQLLKVDPTGAEKHDVIFHSNLYSVKGTEKMTSGFPVIERPYGVVYGYYLAAIADRRMDAYVVSSKLFSVHEWDACAPQIILEEAGGMLTDLRGNKLSYNKLKPEFPFGIIAAARAGIVPFMD